MPGTPTDTKICPECGTKNKATWDFCVKCGEGLSDVAVGEAQVEEPGVAAADGGSMAVVAVVVVVAALATYYAAGFTLSESNVDPGVFARPLEQPRPAAAPHQPDPGVEELWEGRRLLMNGDAGGSLAALAQAVADLPDDPSAHFAYAQALFRTDSVQESLPHFQQAAELAPETFRYHLDHGRARMAAGETDAALAAYESALALRAESPGALRELAITFRRLERTDEAVEALQQAAGMVANSYVLQQDLAGVLEEADRGDEAAEAYRRALEINPGATVSRSRLAHMLFAQGERQEAIDLARQGIAHDPNLPATHRDLGSLLEQSGKAKEAAAAYREYARLAPNAADAQTLVARAGRLDGSASS